ncbi:MAG: hypothetical protein N2258_08485 [Brevinematales bacterium]|nr:hypothetical protein [Brevinematales bacterium]
MLLATSILKPLKQKFPDVFIDIVCGEWALPVIENNPYLRNKIIINVPFANRKNISGLRKKIEFLKTFISSLKLIRKEKYDLGLFLRSRRGNLVSLALLGDIKYTVGHGTAGFGFLFSKEVEWKNGIHEVEHFVEILKPIGIDNKTEDFIPELFPLELHRIFAKTIFNDLKIVSRMAIIHPGSGNLLKTLSIEKWKKVVSILLNKNYEVVITGSNSEVELAKKIATDFDKVKILNGKFDVLSLYEFFKLADLIITVDSLSAHIAGIANVRTYVFYSGLGDVNQWRALGKNITILKNDCPESPCEGKGKYNYAWMNFDIEKILANL